MPPKRPVKKASPKKVSAPKAAAEPKPGSERSALLPGKPARVKIVPSKRPAVAAAPQPSETPEAAAEPAGERYWEAVGRRKTAVARVRLFTKGEKGVWVNSKPISHYFPYPNLQQIAAEALETMKTSDRFRTSVKVSGGGLHAQAEAVRHGTARALTLFNPDFRKRLKRAGFLTRDPRMKERKKFGLKGARRAPQWAKR